MSSCTSYVSVNEQQAKELKDTHTVSVPVPDVASVPACAVFKNCVSGKLSFWIRNYKTRFTHHPPTTALKL